MSNMVVRTNIFALNAHRNMKNVGLEQGRASNRLSSGFRINSAADDAAGLAISENMRAQIRGLDQASRNAQDGQAMLLTTEGGLEEIGNMLQRVRELLVQASNDTNTQNQRVMIEQEVRQLAQEISSMQQRVEFNTNRVLAMGPAMDSGIAGEMALIQEDMNALSDAFAIVNNNLASVAVAREILSALPPLAEISTLNQSQQRALEEALAAIDFSGVADFVSTGMVGEDLLTADAIGSVDSSDVPANTVNMTVAIAALDQRRNDLDAIASELNDHIGNIHDNARNTFNNIADFAAFRAIDPTPAANAGSPPVGATLGSWSFTADPNATPIFVPGGTAPTFDAAVAANNVPTSIVIGDGAGDNGVFEHYIWTVTLTRQTDGTLVATYAERAGTSGDRVETQAGLWQHDGDDWVWGELQDPSAVVAGLAPETPADPYAATADRNAYFGDVLVGTWSWTPASEAQDAVPPDATTGGMDAGSTGNNVAFFQVGANANQGITFDFETVSRAVTSAASNVTMIATLLSNPDAGSGIGRGISVTPLIAQIQGSLDDVNNVRANLGAVQNRMDFTMRSLDISSENLQDSESRVRNADIAREMMRFTMSNVLQQAAVSMLSQANQLPQNLLQLLR
ncbi:MAG: hypothetical protein FWF81_13480 [Defluviitaleaceae bacterium]|nr:hypothetical protein [Defluviitaleaceae bacterium]